jgi:hypothetical protein
MSRNALDRRAQTQELAVVVSDINETIGSLGDQTYATDLAIRVGWALDYAVAVGSSLLRATTPTGQGAPRRGAGTGLQMDPYRISMLEKLRRL